MLLNGVPVGGVAVRLSGLGENLAALLVAESNTPAESVHQVHYVCDCHLTEDRRKAGHGRTGAQDDPRNSLCLCQGGREGERIVARNGDPGAAIKEGFGGKTYAKKLERGPDDEVERAR